MPLEPYINRYSTTDDMLSNCCGDYMEYAIHVRVVDSYKEELDKNCRENRRLEEEVNKTKRQVFQLESIINRCKEYMNEI